MTSLTRLTRIATTIMVVAAVALGSFGATFAGGKSIALAAAPGASAYV